MKVTILAVLAVVAGVSGSAIHQSLPVHHAAPHHSVPVEHIQPPHYEIPSYPDFGFNHQSPVKPSFGINHDNQQQPSFGFNHGSQQQPNFGFDHQSPAQPSFGFNHGSQQQPNFGVNHGSQQPPNFGFNHGSQQQPSFGFNYPGSAQPIFGNQQSPAKPSFGYPQQQQNFGFNPQAPWQPIPPVQPNHPVQVKPNVTPNNQHAVVSQEDDGNLGTLVKKYYSAIRNMLHCGYAPWNVPSFSPFKFDCYEFNLDTDNFKLNGSVSNLVILGMDDFKFLDLTYDEETSIFSFDSIVPKIQLLGEYDIDSMVKIAGFPIDTSGKGVLNMKWEDLRSVGSFKIASSNVTNGLEISELRFHNYLANVEVNNWNDLWNIAANNFANKMLRENLIMLEQQTQGLIVGIYEKYSLPIINQLLGNVTMDQLVGTIKQVTDQLNEHVGNCTNQE